MRFLTLTIAAMLTISATARDNALPDNVYPGTKPGIKVEQVGVDNSLLRVNGNAKYLLIPTQESMDDTRFTVIRDGKPLKTFYARLAKNKVDFYVPLALEEFGEGPLLITMQTPHLKERASGRAAKFDAGFANLQLSDTFSTANREKYRPLYHHTPTYGWMNDPNGMFYKDGVWHLYYQYNPYGSKWQNMTWGHSTSTDLLNWEQQPLALEPDALGSIFSGSSVVDYNNTAGFGPGAIIAMYTAAGDAQTQCLAYSTDDGRTFTKYEGNPIISTFSESRDPNMFWHEPTQQWVLLTAHALNYEMLIYTSPDLKNWTLRSTFGAGLGCQDGVWECPDLVELPLPDGQGSKWVLICNINPGGPNGGSSAQYFVGDFDGATFTPDKDAKGEVPTKWMDYGKDNYAVVSFSNAPENRKTVIGWMSNWQYANEVPTKQYRSANTLPRELSLFRGADGDLYLASTPSPEVDAARGRATHANVSFNAGQSPRTFSLPAANDGICEVTMTIDASNCNDVSVIFSNDVKDYVTFTYDPAKHTLDCDRRASGIVDFSMDFTTRITAPTMENSGTIELRFFIDRSSIETFIDGGRMPMTNIVFPHKPYNRVSVSAQGGKARITGLNVYPVKVNSNK